MFHEEEKLSVAGQFCTLEMKIKCNLVALPKNNNADLITKKKFKSSNIQCSRGAPPPQEIYVDLIIVYQCRLPYYTGTNTL